MDPQPERLTVPMSPVVIDGRRWWSARALAVTFIVALVAFVTGILVAGPKAGRAVVAMSPSPTAQATASTSVIVPLPGMSTYFAAFDGASIIRAVPLGPLCVTDTNGAQNYLPDDSSRWVSFSRVWAASCPVNEAQRASFLTALGSEFLGRAPSGGAQGHSETTGSSEVSFAYELPEQHLAGSATMVTSSLPSGLEVVVILEEHSPGMWMTGSGVDGPSPTILNVCGAHLAPNESCEPLPLATAPN